MNIKTPALFIDKRNYNLTGQKTHRNYVNCIVVTIQIKQAFNFKKLIINVILLLSLTAFSGLNSCFHSGNQKTTKLELRYSYLSLAKKSITYHSARYSGEKVSFKPEDDLNQALLTYNSSLKTKLNHLSSEILLFNIRSKFSGKQPVHQYPDEDTFPSI